MLKISMLPGPSTAGRMPLYQLTRVEFDVIARTFLRVFPQVSLWRADFYPDRPVLGLVGQISPRAVDLERIRERVGRLPDWARDPLLAAPRGFAMLYVGNLTAAADILGAGMVNTDDRPLIEFQAPRLTRIGAAGDKDWFTGESLSAFYGALDRRLADASDPLLPATSAVLDARRAGASLFRYALAKTRGDDRSAASLEAEVRALVPEVISLSDAMGPAGTATEAGRKLLDLEAEQEALRRRLETMQRRLDEMNKGKDKR